MPVPNTFANATATIPLSQLDANFATTITLGNTAIQLGNTVTTLNNMTFANATITSGNVTITNVTVTTANVTTANIATAQIANVTVSGIGTFAAGSNTAPSITTSGDTNTGIFFPAADTIAFTEGGVESMRIDSAGRLGISTSSPSTWGTNLVVYGNQLTVTGAGYDGTFADSIYFGGNNEGTTYRNRIRNSLSSDASQQQMQLSVASGSSTFIDALTLNGLGNLVLSGGTKTANGIGITFPATQSASSNANTLDDYEEGTFTPTITYVTPGTLSVGYQTQLGRYTKVGRIVFIEITIRLNAFTKGTASGDLLIANLPFAFPASDPLSLFNIGFFQSSFSQFPVAIAFSGAAQMYLLASANNTGWASQPDPDSNAQYFLSGSYTVA